MRENFKTIKLDGSIAINLGERGVWRSEKRNILSYIQEICREYQANGDTLTLRQLYYQLVSKDAVPNHDKVYKKISSLKDELVMGGYVDWAVFEDRGRVPIEAYYEEGIKEALEWTAKNYRLYRQDGQTNTVEVWTEKDAISGILKKVTLPYGIKLVVNKGYTSTTAVYGAYARFMEEIAEGNKITILYFGDHDPSGIDMIRDIKDRLENMLMFGERFWDKMQDQIEAWWEENEYTILDICDLGEEYEKVSRLLQDDDEELVKLCDAGKIKMYMRDKELFKVIPIGLTMEQIRLYNPPPNPAKITDPRAKEYVRKYGKVSWEVDAIKPNLMREIVENAIREQIQIDVYEGVLEQEKADKEEIRLMIDSLDKTEE